ncbi:MAG: hypothetical protein JL50_16900 [Peptococcaceae bacterium BICA1-7]|nr:MAG: hypothetical protein JL50_16900 [Peptococcaceae bacterium BICA1-7]HBV96528.1 efflux RND transporter periplasmic adaptor subunit [Desulfotomaculum sp.]
MQAGIILQKIKQRKKVLAAVVALILLVLVIGLNFARGRGEEVTPVQSAGVELKEIEDTVLVSGRLRLVEKQEIYADSDLTVKKIHVQPGDLVKAGQLLIELYDGDVEGILEEAKATLDLKEAEYRMAIARLPIETRRYRAELERAEAGMAAAQSKYDRYKTLYSQGAVSAQEFEAAEVDLKSAGAQLETARVNLESRESGSIPGDEILSLEAGLNVARAQFDKAQKRYDHANVKAEVDGMVFSIEVSEGDAVAPRTRLLTVGNPDRLEIAVSIGEGDSSKVSSGQRAEIKAAAKPGKKYSGAVTSVSPGAVAKSNDRGGVSMEIPVIIQVEGDTAGLRPGYTADVTIITTEKKSSLVIPYEAVAEDGDKKFVYVIDNSRAKKTYIQTGLDTELYTEVTGGLKEGDRIVISPLDKIKDGGGVKEVPGIKAPQEAK